MDDLSAQLADMMREYTSEVEVAVSNAIEEAGKELLKDVKEKSPKSQDGGDYQKGWCLKIEQSGSKKTAIVYNKTRYHLTHLLEHGHAKRNGGRVNAIPHIKPAEEKAETELMRRIEEAIGG